MLSLQYNVSGLSSDALNPFIANGKVLRINTIMKCRQKSLAVRISMFGSWFKLVTNDCVIKMMMIVTVVNAVTVSIYLAIM